LSADCLISITISFEAKKTELLRLASLYFSGDVLVVSKKRTVLTGREKEIGKRKSRQSKCRCLCVSQKGTIVTFDRIDQSNRRPDQELDAKRGDFTPPPPPKCFD